MVTMLLWKKMDLPFTAIGHNLQMYVDSTTTSGCEHDWATIKLKKLS